MFASSDGGPRELKMKQIKNWAGSETDKSSADYHPPKKIKFPLGVSLISACYANDEEEFKQLLGMGIDIDTRNPDGMTCVHQVYECLLVKEVHSVASMVITSSWSFSSRKERTSMFRTMKVGHLFMPQPRSAVRKWLGKPQMSFVPKHLTIHVNKYRNIQVKFVHC